jgi:hypothetical protein
LWYTGTVFVQNKSSLLLKIIFTNKRHLQLILKQKLFSKVLFKCQAARLEYWNTKAESKREVLLIKIRECFLQMNICILSYCGIIVSIAGANVCVKGSTWESSKMGKIEPKTEVHTNNGFPPFVLFVELVTLALEIGEFFS